MTRRCNPMSGRGATATSVLLVALACTVPTATHAAERKLGEAEIRTLLDNNTVAGEDKQGAWKQFFDANGATTYVQGTEPPSHGRWTVRGGKYCSQWPPAEGWACYEVTSDPTADPVPITWIGDSGGTYPGIVLMGNKL